MIKKSFYEDFEASPLKAYFVRKINKGIRRIFVMKKIGLDDLIYAEFLKLKSGKGPNTSLSQSALNNFKNTVNTLCEGVYNALHEYIHTSDYDLKNKKKGMLLTIKNRKVRVQKIGSGYNIHGFEYSKLRYINAGKTIEILLGINLNRLSDSDSKHELMLYLNKDNSERYYLQDLGLDGVKYSQIKRIVNALKNIYALIIS